MVKSNVTKKLIQPLSILTCAALLAGCESFMTINTNTPNAPDTSKPVSQPSCPEVEQTNNVQDKVVFGQLEYTTINPSGWRMKSRIDSGATTTSIDARDIKPFERDGQSWVRFNLFDRNNGKTFEIEKPVSRIVEIKRHGTEKQKRYVVELELTIGSVSDRVEVSLTDRSDFTYPVLIGRNFMMDRAIIDVSKKYVAKKAAQ